MKIGWDSDGVLYRFTKSHYQWLNAHHGMDLDIESEPPEWDYFLELGMTVQEFLDSMDAAVDARHLFWEGELYEPNIAQNLRDLKAAGHTNHLVTHRFSGKTACSREATLYFYEKQGIEFDSIEFSKDKSIAKTDIFLEDNLKNYDALEAAGIPCFLVNRPYNQENDDRRRVNSVQEFTDLILESSCSLVASF